MSLGRWVVEGWTWGEVEGEVCEVFAWGAGDDVGVGFARGCAKGWTFCRAEGSMDSRVPQSTAFEIASFIRLSLQYSGS